MTHEEKAKELVDKFMPHSHNYEPPNGHYDSGEYHAKQCAIITVEFAQQEAIAFKAWCDTEEAKYNPFIDNEQLYTLWKQKN